MKKIINLSLVLVLVGAFTFSMNSNAASLSRTYTGSFASTWAKSASSGQAKLEYGFNTALIDEDLAYAYHSNSQHNAKIKNGSGTTVGPTKKAGVWSNKEVRHSGGTVTYYCEW